MELVTINLSQLCLRRGRARSTATDFVLERMLLSDGIKVPIPVIVRKISDDLFEVIDGERRVSKAKDLAQRGSLDPELFPVPCYVVDAPTDEEFAYWRLVGNLGETLPPDELVTLYQKLGEKVSVKRSTEVADEVALARINDIIVTMAGRQNTIRGSRRLLEVIEAVRDHVMGGISVTDTMHRIKRAGGEE